MSACNDQEAAVDTVIQSKISSEVEKKEPSRTGCPPQILVVEDSGDMREFLRRVLVRCGYRFLEAADGIEGINLARAKQPDLILMDLSLPHLDGLQATRQLKTDPILKRIPVIAVTAHARAADADQAREAGCDGYMSKPYSLKDLLSIVDAYAPLGSVKK